MGRQFIYHAGYQGGAQSELFPGIRHHQPVPSTTLVANSDLKLDTNVAPNQNYFPALGISHIAIRGNT